MSNQNAKNCHHWRSIFIVLWISFLGATIASILFFATFDPPDLGNIATFPASLSREAGYTIGFLLIWSLLALNGFLAHWLASSAR